MHGTVYDFVRVRRVVIARATVEYSNPVRFTRESVTEEAGTYPVIASLPDGTLVAWTGGSMIESVLRVARYAPAR